MIRILISLPWSGIFLIVASLILIGIFLHLSSFYDKVNKDGIEVDGIVFSVDRKSINFFMSSINLYNYYYEPTIRFLTKENVWVTQRNKMSLIASYLYTYTEGEKVKVKYDPEDPSNFIICQYGMASFSIYTLLVVGFILFGCGVFQIIQS